MSPRDFENIVVHQQVIRYPALRRQQNSLRTPYAPPNIAKNGKSVLVTTTLLINLYKCQQDATTF